MSIENDLKKILEQRIKTAAKTIKTSSDQRILEGIYGKLLKNTVEETIKETPLDLAKFKEILKGIYADVAKEVTPRFIEALDKEEIKAALDQALTSVWFTDGFENYVENTMKEIIKEYIKKMKKETLAKIFRDAAKELIEEELEG